MPARDSAATDYAGLGLAEPWVGIATVADRLRAAVALASQKARSRDRPVLAWTTSEISPAEPIGLFERSAELASDPMLWWRPDEDFSLVGAGCAWSFTGEGRDRFLQAGKAWQILMDGAVGPGLDCDRLNGDGFNRTKRGTAPVVMGGFSFVPEGPAGPEWEGYPAGLLVLPRLLVTRAGRACRLTLTVVMRPDGRGPADADTEVEQSLGILAGLLRSGSAAQAEVGDASSHSGVSRLTPSPLVAEEFPQAGRWKDIVAAAAHDVRREVIRKVVLARGLRVRAAGFDWAQTLRRLRAGYPTCTLFAVARGDRCFLGATPERLVRVEEGRVSAMALAGSAPRGETEDEDRRLGAMLLASAKERIEHAVVVEELREAISAACMDVSVAAGPSVLAFHNVQHLYTPITARLRDRSTVLDLVGRLHPTPAVGGVPRDEALGWIRRHEGLDRGWYAGPVGWMDRDGEGEFDVAIRSALVCRDEALLYAGCGIVRDSDPDQEYAESNLKLQPMLSALGSEGSMP